MVVIIFGVSGAGKTTVGKLVAERLGWIFLDADDFHSPENIEKMKRGVPLREADRKPWLETLRQRIAQSLRKKENAILACSALKRAYRNELRIDSNIVFVFLRGDRQRIAKQMRGRSGHFMDPALLDSQFADLEEPQPDEDVIVVELSGTVEEAAQQVFLRVEARLE